MAEFSIVIWMILLSVLSGGVAQYSSKTALNNSTFECQLQIENVKWNIKCESQNFFVKSSSKFFVAKLRGTFDPVSPALYDELLQTTSLSESELYLCDSQWKYVLKIDPSVLHDYCTSNIKLLRKLIRKLNETSLRRIEISNTSKSDFLLNILHESTHLSHLTLQDNILSNLFFPVYINNTIVSVILERNKIENITENFFRKFPSLVLLDLSNNLLKYVRKSLFGEMSTISELDLSYNIIESISSDAFSNLASLNILYLNNNNLKHIDENVFKFNHLLSEIDISSNKLINLSSTLFHNLPNLKNISCSNCSLFTFNKGLFANSPYISHINLSNNNLKFVHEDSFKELGLLEVLDLGSNKISYLNENHFKKKQYLKYVNLNQNEIQQVKSGLFMGAPNLRVLDLSENKIQTLTDDHVKNFTDLEYLTLRHNRMISVELGLTAIFVYIRILDISDNLIAKFNVGWKRLVYMEKFMADNNQLTSLDLPPCVPSVKQTLTFSFRYNNISTINTEALYLDESRAKTDRSMAQCFFNGREKNFVDLTHNPLFCDCKIYPFYKYLKEKSPRKIEMFLDKENLICAGPQHVSNQPLIYLLDDVMSCPLIQECPEYCFCGVRGQDNMIFVNCSAMNLTEVPQIIPEGTSALYFNDNQLESMMSLNSYVWKNLSELHLDQNSLENLDGWNIPASLHYLSLRKNKLKTLTSSLMNYISNRSNFQLFLGYNDENCDCDRKKLKSFLIEYMKFVEDNEDIICIVTNNETSTVLPLTAVPDSDLCPIYSYNLNYYQKKLVISLCILFTFLISLLLVYYKQRQLILSFFYIHCDDLFRFCFSEDDYDENHVFDAFIAYSSSERDIVMELMDELETKPPFFKLCIHERNWLPGRFITDNIINSVHSSKRTIVILSSAFIASPWFNLELRAAVSKMSKDKMCKVIVILAEKSVSIDNIDSELKHVISKRTYLVWGERWFWEKLRYAMPRKKCSKNFNENNWEERRVSEVPLIPEAT